MGFAGPVGLRGVDRIYADYEHAAGNDWIAGANRADAHVRHLDLHRDVTLPIEWADIRNAVAGDPCPCCGRPVELKRGIEVGHIFKLGTKYSESMKAVFLDENGREKPMIMGCYGIGVSRVVAACIEQPRSAQKPTKSMPFSRNWGWKCCTTTVRNAPASSSRTPISSACPPRLSWAARASPAGRWKPRTAVPGKNPLCPPRPLPTPSPASGREFLTVGRDKERP